MIVEKMSSGSTFKKLFNDFFIVARETVRSGQVPAFDTASYGALATFAAAEQEALIKLGDGTANEKELVGMFQSLWALETQFINCESSTKAGFRTDEYWEMLINATDAFVKKHCFSFAKSVVVCFLDEVERRDIAERKETKDTAA